MARLGMDVDTVELAARTLLQSVAQVTLIKTTVGRIVSESQGVWQGRDAAGFLSDWRTSEAQIRKLVQAMDEFGRKLQAQASDQRRASSELNGGIAQGTPKSSRRNPYTRDEPATNVQLRDIDTRLKVLSQPAIGEHFPEAYAKAVAWGTELKANPSPSAADVAAFQKYCYLLSTAKANREVVCDFAEIASDNYTEGSKAGVEAVVSAAGLGKVTPMSMNQMGSLSGGHVAAMMATGGGEGLDDWAKSTLRGIGVGALAQQDVSGIVLVYDQQADAYLSALYAAAHDAPTSSVLEGSQVMMTHNQEFTGRLAEMRIEAEKVGAFDFMTGTGTPTDGSLRGVLKVVPGVKEGLGLSEVGGNLGKEKVALDVSAEAYRQATIGGMDSLIRAAQMSGFQE